MLAAESWDINDDHLLLGLEVLRSNGPWELGSKVRKINGLAKYKTHRNNVDMSLLVSAYANKWRSTDQIPVRAVSEIGRFGFVDPSLGGKSHRFSLITNLTTERWAAGAYMSNYSLNLFQNPTYFLNDPLNGDAIEQHDSRWVMGMHANTSFSFNLHTFRIGGDLRYDAVAKADLYSTTNRVRRENLIDTRLKEFSVGTFL